MPTFLLNAIKAFYMEPNLTIPELRLRSFLKLLIFLSVVTLFFQIVPQWQPGFLVRILATCYLVLAGGSLLLGGLIIVLLMLAIGDMRRFSVLVRVLSLYFLAATVWAVLRWILKKDQGDVLVAPRAITLAIVTILLWLLFSLAQKARYGLSYLSVMQFQTLQ